MRDPGGPVRMAAARFVTCGAIASVTRWGWDGTATVTTGADSSAARAAWVHMSSAGMLRAWQQSAGRTVGAGVPVLVLEVLSRPSQQACDITSCIALQYT